MSEFKEGADDKITLFQSSKVNMSNNEYFILIIASMIEVINSNEQNMQRKINKEQVITYFKNNNFNIKTIESKGSKKLSFELKEKCNISIPITKKLCRCIDEYYQFIYNILLSLDNTVSQQINKNILIEYIISNKIDEKTFKQQDKNEFIEHLINECKMPKLMAQKSHEQINNHLISKFILETNDRDHIIYSFGIKYWYKKWREEFNDHQENVLVKARFVDLKDEVINSDGKILFNIKEWTKEYKTAQENQEREECKKYCKNSKRVLFSVDIKPNAVISIHHLIAVQLYCNATAEQKQFSATYRRVKCSEKKEEDSIEDVIKEHCYYANWGRLLFEAVNVFGNRQWDERHFYHGIDKEMVFGSTTRIHIYGPLSTTSDRDIAIGKFARSQGMVLKIDGTINNCFNCEWISNFKDEKEYLFIGSKKPFKINSVCLYRNKWIFLEVYMNAINKIIDETTKINDDANLIKQKLNEIKDDISNLSLDELQNNLDKFAQIIAIEKHQNDEGKLAAIGWIIRLYHYYLNKKSSISSFICNMKESNDEGSESDEWQQT